MSRFTTEEFESAIKILQKLVDIRNICTTQHYGSDIFDDLYEKITPISKDFIDTVDKTINS